MFRCISSACLYQTYGLPDFADHRAHRVKVWAYRFAVRNFIPHVAYAITLRRRNHEPPQTESAEAIEIDREADAAAVLGNWLLTAKAIRVLKPVC